MTSKVIVTNNILYTYLPIRKSQVVLNTWHGGGAIKKFGLASPDSTEYDRFFFQIQNKKYTAFSRDSLIGEKKIINDGFGYYGTILRFGLPRNAVLQILIPITLMNYSSFRQEVDDKSYILYLSLTFGFIALLLMFYGFRG